MLFRYDVLCVGSATVDRFLSVDTPFSALHLGDKILVTSSEIHSGGSATNSAAALSRLGLRVSMLTKLGSDHDADFVLQEMKRVQVSNLCHQRSRKETDSSTIISSSREHNRIIFTHKSASQDLNLQDLRSFPKFSPRWIYLGSLVGKSFSVAKQLAHLAEKSQVKLLFNPSLYLAAKGKRYLAPILRATSLLVLNKEEAAALAGKSFPPSQMLRRLQMQGPSSVVITDGKNKIFALHEGKEYSATPPPVRVVETTGAGDAFTSGLLAGLIKQWSFEDCLRLGLLNSAAVLQHIGAKNDLLSEREAVQLLKKKKIKVSIAQAR